MSTDSISADAETPLMRLNAALNAVADALASADLARLLAAEPALCAALDGMAGSTDVDRPSLDRARSALLRCRRLGAGLVAFTRLTLDPEGVHVYSRSGGDNSLDMPARGVSMEARV